MKQTEFPQRQVHLDFHTSADIPGVGVDFDPDAFAATFKRAHVNSVTIFATCHHGMCYYPSRVAPMHPSLTFDLLGAQIAALHAAGIRCPIYLTVAFNVSASERHPEWYQRTVDGKIVGGGITEAGWPWLCVGADDDAYADELLAQTNELIDRYGDACDGFFYDILMYHADGCVCVSCLKQLRTAGLDPLNPLHRRRNNHVTARRFMKRITDLVRARRPDATLFFNSRWGAHFADESEYYTQVEIESLPTGGWGYGFYPLWSRYGRNFGLPMLGMTGRFHRSWADWGGLKHPDALKFECGGILASGGAVSIGDQLHPSGRLSEAVYDVIGEVFAEVETLEPFLTGATAVTDVGLLLLNPDADKANMAAAGMVQESPDAIEGAAKMLLECHAQFDVISDRSCDDFSRYACLVIPDFAPATPKTVERLRDFVRGGGKLLLSNRALLDGGNFALAEEMGLDFVGEVTSVPDYFAVTDPGLRSAVVRAGFWYCLYEGPACRVAPRPGTEVLGEARGTYFNRTPEQYSSHGFTPPLPDGESAGDYPAILRNGNVMYLYGAFFTAYQRYGALTLRDIVKQCLARLLPEPILTTDASAQAEVTVMRQVESGRHIAYIVNYSPQRRAPRHVEILDAPVPLRDVEIRLRRAEPTNRVFLALSGETLPFTVAGGTVTVVVPRVNAYAAVVFES